jgi:hypothetical protein
MLLVLVFLTRKEIIPSVETLQKLRDIEKLKNSKDTKSKNIKHINSDLNSDIIDGWDTGFATIETIRKKMSKELPRLSSAPKGKKEIGEEVMKLAQEFFEMYGSLDFSTCVICTKTSQIFPLNLFIPGNEEDLPDSLEKYKDWALQQPLNRRLNVKTPLCVQDPFVLGYNVGCVTPFSILLKFQVACKKTAKDLKSGSATSLLHLLVPV